MLRFEAANNDGDSWAIAEGDTRPICIISRVRGTVYFYMTARFDELREIADFAEAKMKNPELTRDEIAGILRGIKEMHEGKVMDINEIRSKLAQAQHPNEG